MKPGMRASGVPWLEVVPESWPTKPLMSLMSEVKRPNVGMIEDNLLSLSHGRIVRKDIAGSDGLLPESYETYQVVERGDLVFRLTDLQNDKRSLRSARVCERGIVTSAYAAASPTAEVDSRFMNYLMRAYDQAKVFYALGGGVRQSLKFDDIRRLPVATPSSDEQRAIADFLDGETAQVDKLIAKQDRFIATLRERSVAFRERELIGRSDVRSTTVRRALTKLSRPAVPGRGVVTAYRDGRVTHRSNRREDGYTMSDLEQGYQEIRVGEIVFHGLDGFAGAVGVSDSHGNATPAYHVCIPTGQDDPDFIALHLRQLGTSGLLSTLAPNVRQRSVDFRNWSTFGRVPLDLPTPEAQRASVEAIRVSEARVNMLIAKAERLIELSRERRAALITAAVTGQIDVRGAA